jgi:hypothetical protein
LSLSYHGGGGGGGGCRYRRQILKKINFCSIHYVGIEMMSLTDGHTTRIDVYVKKGYK